VVSMTAAGALLSLSASTQPMRLPAARRREATEALA